MLQVVCLLYSILVRLFFSLQDLDNSLGRNQWNGVMLVKELIFKIYCPFLHKVFAHLLVYTLTDAGTIVEVR